MGFFREKNLKNIFILKGLLKIMGNLEEEKNKRNSGFSVSQLDQSSLKIEF
jgi:hypothetical protein